MTWTISPDPVCGGISIIDENGRGVAIVIQRDPHPTLGQGVTLEEAERRARVMALAPELLNDLREAASTLRRYEALHRAKNTEESTAKADVNAALADRFEKTIARARGEE